MMQKVGAEMPVYGTYGDDFDEQLHPYIERLCGVRGLVACREAEVLYVAHGGWGRVVRRLHPLVEGA